MKQFVEYAGIITMLLGLASGDIFIGVGTVIGSLCVLNWCHRGMKW